MHTKGPWFHAGPIGAGQYIVSENAPIAVAYRQNTIGVAGANAFLIASAPELYEALKAIERSMTEYGGRDIPEWLEERMVAGRAAIAKAEGR